MIEILSYEQVNKKKLVGYLDVKMTMNGIKMVLRRIPHFYDGTKEWLGLPSFSIPQADGKYSYHRYWELDLQAHNTQLLENISTAFKEYKEKNKIKMTTPAPLHFGGEPTEEIPF